MGIMRCLRNGLPLLLAGLLTLGLSLSIGAGLLLTLGTGSAMAQAGDTSTTELPDLPGEKTVFVNNEVEDEEGEDEPQTAEVLDPPEDSSCDDPDEESIQDGVDAANDGDTVVVCEGRYVESVDVDESITVRAETDTSSGEDDEDPCDFLDDRDDASVVTPDGDAKNAFNLQADDIRLRGFRVTGAMNNAGIFTSPNASGYRIVNNLIEENTFGLYLNSDEDGESIVRGNCFRDNNTGLGVQSAAGNGIYSDQGLSNATITRNESINNQNAGITLAGTQEGVDILRNTSEDETLVAAFNTSNSEIRENGVSGNEFSAIFLSTSEGLSVEDNEITGGGGSGIVLAGVDASSVTNNDVAGNLFDGIRLTDDDPDFDGSTEDGDGSTGNTVEGNDVTGSGRDGLRVTDRSEDNTFTDNSALITNDSSGLDCRDQTDGDGTAGTANTYTGNVGDTDDPDGICAPAPGGGPGGGGGGGGSDDSGDDAGGNPGGGNGSGGGGGNGSGGGNNDNDGDDAGVLPPPLGGVLGTSNTCGLFRQNFGGPARAGRLALCVAATNRVLGSVAPLVVTPTQACTGTGLSKKRRRGFRRSDYGACVRSVQLTLTGLGRIF